VRARLKAETHGHSAKTFRSLARKYEINHSIIKKYLDIKRQAKKTAPSQTDRQKRVINLQLKLISLLLSQTTNASWMMSHGAVVMTTDC
jgi:DNA topoisomerase IB